MFTSGFDSTMSRDEALRGSPAPFEHLAKMMLVDIPYFGFDGKLHDGQLVVHQDVAEDTRRIFSTLVELRFPLEKMVPIVAYGWDDDASMADNNTSAFNYRVIFGTERLSNHADGRAIDLNPLQNPYDRLDGTVMPPGASYDTSVRGTVTLEIVDLFLSHGWKWGGNWTDRKDWQHFEKPMD